MTTDEQPLSPDEFAQFKSLLRRYCKHDLDQWLNLEVTFPPQDGPVYVMISRAEPPNKESHLFHELGPA